MINNFNTSRLSLSPVTLSASEFIFQLVNTPEWIKFIGDRNVKNLDDASQYIQRLIDNPDITYWVVKLKDTDTSVGTISFIKRNYLDHPDIGFAFLSAYQKCGYAYEAASIVLSSLLDDPAINCILATVAPGNVNSIRLLEKLGMNFLREIEVDGKRPLLYQTVANKLYI